MCIRDRCWVCLVVLGNLDYILDKPSYQKILEGIKGAGVVFNPKGGAITSMNVGDMVLNIGEQMIKNGFNELVPQQQQILQSAVAVALEHPEDAGAVANILEAAGVANPNILRGRGDVDFQQTAQNIIQRLDDAVTQRKGIPTRTIAPKDLPLEGRLQGKTPHYSVGGYTEYLNEDDPVNPQLGNL